MEAILILLFDLILMMIPAVLLVFSCIKLYRILQNPEGDYHNQAFLTALWLCLFVLAAGLIIGANAA